MKIPFVQALYKRLIFILKWLKELNSTIYVLRIDEIKSNNLGDTELIVAFTGKFNFMVMHPADIMNNEDTLRCFSPSDIKKIIQLAMYDEQKHDYKIVSQSFSYEDINSFFTIKNLKTSEFFTINTLELYQNEDLLRHFMIKDILSISHSFHHIKHEQASSAMRELCLNNRKENFKIVDFK